MATSDHSASESYLLKETAEFLGLPWSEPTLIREFWQVSDGSSISSLRWFDGEPDMVMLHGGGQNAHTWDAVALLLGKPIVAIDLPGHGHSNWREDKEYWPITNAERIAEVIDQMGIKPKALVGMSLGGLTTIHLAALRPELFESVVVIDVTPSQMEQMQKMSQEERGTTALTQGPTRFASREEMIEATALLAPGRDRVLIERGVVHNSRQFEDGQWGWRYDSLRSSEDEQAVDFNDLWSDVELIPVPMMLVLGGASAFVTAEHRQDFQARAKDLRVEVVEGSGHSVQSDRPVQLAALLGAFIYATTDEVLP